MAKPTEERSRRESGESKKDRRIQARTARERQARRRVHRKRLWQAGVAAAVMVVVGSVTFALARGGVRTSSKGTPTGSGTVSFSGDFRVGGMVQSLALPALGSNGSITYDRFRNGPLVVNFFASWCPFCIHEMPAFETVYRSLGGKVAFLGVSQRDSRGASLDLMRKTGVTYPAALDEQGRFFDSVGTGGMPTTLFVQPGGRIAYVQIGPLDEGTLRQFITRYLGVS